MMQIGRRIYYELATGNVILDMGEREGEVIETTQDQDFLAYTALQPYQKSSVGVIQCDYGYNTDNFSKYPFHIDITKNPIDETAIVWDTVNPYGASLAQVQQSKISQVTDLYNQTLEAGFPSSCTGKPLVYDYSTESQKKWGKLFPSLSVLPDSLLPLPITIKDGTVIPHTKDQLIKLWGDLLIFELPLEAKYQAYTSANGSIMSATTVDQVNVISW